MKLNQDLSELNNKDLVIQSEDVDEQPSQKKKKKQFPKWAIISIIAGAVICLGICYYFFLFTPLKDQIQEAYAETEEVNTKTELEQVKLASMSKMQKAIEENKDLGTIRPYDDVQREMDDLNLLLKGVNNYQATFMTPNGSLDSEVIRRNVMVSFTCDNYPQAYNIIKEIKANELRKFITNITVSSSYSGGASVAGNEVAGLNGTKDPVAVSISMFFLETTNGVEDTTGIFYPTPVSEITEEDDGTSEEDEIYGTRDTALRAN